MRMILKFVNLIILFAFILVNNSCSKKDFLPLHEYNAAAVKKFLTVPENASPVLKTLITNWAKMEKEYHFTTDFIKKNGMPVWDKSVSNLSIRSNFGLVDVTTNSVSPLADTSPSAVNNGIFFIPFIDTVTKEISAYIVCNQTGDSSYTYQYFNKKDILHYQVKNNLELSNGRVLLGVMASFENSINNNRNVSYPSPYNADYSGALIFFSNTKQTNKQIVRNSSNTINTFSVGGDGEPADPCISYVYIVYGGYNLVYEKNNCNGTARLVGTYLINAGTALLVVAAA